VGVARLVWVEDDVERLGECWPHGAVFVDVDLRKEDMVAQAADLVVTACVDA